MFPRPKKLLAVFFQIRIYNQSGIDVVEGFKPLAKTTPIRCLTRRPLAQKCWLIPHFQQISTLRPCSTVVHHSQCEWRFSAWLLLGRPVSRHGKRLKILRRQAPRRGLINSWIAASSSARHEWSTAALRDQHALILGRNPSRHKAYPRERLGQRGSNCTAIFGPAFHSDSLGRLEKPSWLASLNQRWLRSVRAGVCQVTFINNNAPKPAALHQQGSKARIARRAISCSGDLKALLGPARAALAKILQASLDFGVRYQQLWPRLLA
ncbi:hypothetical protein AG0111_0g11832 [Alternaria gaisen]|uniref:Uncharacterized protein n=1 Tax=Alternaria gaisen TaxID=167740 RepID=A0ACB6F619_9PLEO|nr:hypothetical protein AG0111_0g11832 [Alternaria gaisen]